VLDFVVVITGWIQLVSSGANFSMLRALKPLRSVKRVRKLRVLVQCIVKAMPALGSIAVILVFVCATLGIIGTQLFMGSTRHACHDCVGGHWEGDTCVGGEMENSGDVCWPMCARDKNNIGLLNLTQKGCDAIGGGCGPEFTPGYSDAEGEGLRYGWCTSLGNVTLGQYRLYGDNFVPEAYGQTPLIFWTCRPNQQCRCGNSGDVNPNCTILDNPNYGANNFDNVLWASFTMFQAITLEGWVDTMYTVIDGSGVMAFIYFVVAVLFGACIILNLFLAVLCDNFAIADDDPEDGPKEKEVDAEAEATEAAKHLKHESAFRNKCLVMAQSPKFMYFITGCILLNAVLMMLMMPPDAEAEGHALSNYEPSRTGYQPPTLFYTLWFLNMLLTVIFTFESAVKLIGLGWKVFKMDSFNTFDLVVVIVSLGDVGMDIGGVFAGANIPPFFPVSVLRTFRIIRVLKLARQWENLRVILVTLVKSLKSVMYLCILMLLFILIWALLGMELFGGRFPRPEYNYTAEYYPLVFSGETQDEEIIFEDGPSRYNFDSFGEAFLSIFVILSGENWNEIWFDAHAATVIPWTMKIATAAQRTTYPLLADQKAYSKWDFIEKTCLSKCQQISQCCGTACLTTECRAVDQWEGALRFYPDGNPVADEVGPSIGIPTGRYKATIFFFILFITGNLIMFNLFIAILLSNFEDGDDDGEDEDEEEEEDEEDMGGLDAAVAPRLEGGPKDMPMMSYTFGGYRAPQEAEMRKSGLIKVGGEANAVPVGQDEEPKPRRKSVTPAPDEESGDRSCLLFSWANPVRRGAAYVVWHPWFDPFIIFLIIFSSIMLAIDDPRADADRTIKVFVENVGWFFTVAFIIEMLLKIIVLGFIHSKTPTMPAYLRSGWNVLDFCVVVISILTIMADSVPALKVVSSLKALRTFRALRPLRLISRLEGMKQVINTLIKSVPSVGTLGVVALLFFTIFDIVGMQLFAGKLGSCLDPNGSYRDTGDALNAGYLGSAVSAYYEPGYECVGRASCTSLHKAGKEGDFPEADLYPRADPKALLGAATYMDPTITVGRMPGKSLLELCTCPPDTALEECGSQIPCWSKPLPDGKILTLVDYDKSGVINDYEECMSLPKYNLTRRDSLGRELHMIEHNEENWESGSMAWAPELFYQFPQWVNPNFGSFDHFGEGFLLLFEVAALEGWPDVMFWVMDSDQYEFFVEPSRTEQHQYGRIKRTLVGTEPDGQRYWGPGNHLSNSWPVFFFGPLFFVLWILFGSFIILNMVIGVVLDAYNRIKSEGSGTAFMTTGQAEWVATQRSIIAMRPLKAANPPAQEWRMGAYKLVTWNIFDLFIMGVIISNMIFMFLDFHDPEYPNMKDIRTASCVANMTFLIIYIIEMVLKFAGLGIQQYFKDSWNKFDFTLVVLSLIDVDTCSDAPTNDFPLPASVIRVLRLFRVVRILRIFKTAKSLRAILMTIILSVPALYNIAMLLFLFIFIFACFCVSFFFSVSYTDPKVALQYPSPETFWYSTTSSYGDFVNRHANFETFGMALLTLVRCVTGESFNGIMHDTMNPDWGDNMLRCCPTCGFVVDDKPVSSCGKAGVSVLLFVLYCLFMSFVLLALIIGVILDNFANVGSDNKAVTVENIEEFREVWLRYDPKGTFVVPSHNLLAILQQLKQPLGIADCTPALSRAQMLQYLGELDIPDHGGSVHFLEALTALTHKVCGVPVPLCDATSGLQKAAQKVPKLASLEKPAHNALTNYLVSLLQSRWRGYAMRKKYSDHALGEAAPDADGAMQKAAESDASGKVKPNQVAPAP
jgi:hypothetical protein